MLDLIFTTQNNLLNYLKKNQINQWALVPTMGAIHQGHLSLINSAYAEFSTVIISIFVNPTQFDDKKDLKFYPINYEKDIEMLNKHFKNILIYMPTVDDIYKNEVKSMTYDFGDLDKVMEGEFRMGHFNGVATVVELLLSALKPIKAYFGEKDFQQLQIIKSLVRQKQIDCEIVECPTIREENGLALSSRNQKLTQKEKKEASFLYKTMQLAKEMKQNKEQPKHIKEHIYTLYKDHEYISLEYFLITNQDTLLEATEFINSKKYRVFVAAKIGNTRLIDNLLL